MHRKRPTQSVQFNIATHTVGDMPPTVRGHHTRIAIVHITTSKTSVTCVGRRSVAVCRVCATVT